MYCFFLRINHLIGENQSSDNLIIRKHFQFHPIPGVPPKKRQMPRKTHLLALLGKKIDAKPGLQCYQWTVSGSGRRMGINYIIISI